MEIFDASGINFMGLFLSSNGNKYILVSIDYVCKWIEVVAYPTNDSQVVIKMFKNTILSRFNTPRLVISDGVSHFISKYFKNLLTNMELNTKLRPLIIRIPADRWKYIIERLMEYFKKKFPPQGKISSQS